MRGYPLWPPSCVSLGTKTSSVPPLAPSGSAARAPRTSKSELPSLPTHLYIRGVVRTQGVGFPANIAHVHNYMCLRTGRVSTTPRLIVMHLLVADTGATVVPLFYSTLITGSLKCTRPKEERRFISHLATHVCVHAHVAIKTTSTFRRSRGISGQCRKSLVATPLSICIPSLFTVH